MKKSRNKILLLCVLSCIFVSIWIFFSKCSSTNLAYILYPGQSLLYHVVYESHSEADFRVLFEDTSPEQKNDASSGLVQTIRTHLEGDLAFHVLDKRDHIYLVCFRLTNPLVILNINGMDNASEARLLAGVLSHDIFSEINSRGRILSVLFDPDLPKTPQSYAQALLAKIQFVLPEEKYVKGRLWQAEEEDPNGTYIALYEERPINKEEAEDKENFSLSAFQKTRMNYLPSLAQSGLSQSQSPSLIQPNGNLKALFNKKEGILVELSGFEMDEIFISEKRVAQTESHLAMNLKKKEAIPSTLQSSLDNTYHQYRSKGSPITLSTLSSEEESETALQRNALGESTLDSLLTELEEAEQSGGELDTELYLKFKALVYLHPEECAILGDRLAEAPSHSQTEDILSTALVTIGHAQAQSALLTAIQKRSKDSLSQADLVQTLSMVASPTTQTVQTLRELASRTSDLHLSATALLGLGTAAKNLYNFDASGSKIIVNWILSQFNNSADENYVHHLLQALGNSGSTEALPVLKKYSKHHSPYLRIPALVSLRFMNSEEADLLLTEALISDPDPHVRSEAVFAMTFRQPVKLIIETQKKALLEDTSEMVRLAVLSNLGELLREFPDLFQIIQKVSQDDPSEQIRKHAAEILKKFS